MHTQLQLYPNSARLHIQGETVELGVKKLNVAENLTQRGTEEDRTENVAITYLGHPKESEYKENICTRHMHPARTPGPPPLI